MSEIFLPKHHIDVLVSAAIELGIIVFVGPRELAASAETASDIGRMLWAENARSVADARRRWLVGGPNTPDRGQECQAAIEGYGFRHYPGLRSGAIAKALDCYDDQSGECSDYPRSDAAEFVRRLRLALLRGLPGYGPAPLVIDTMEKAEAARRPFPRAVHPAAGTGAAIAA